MSNLITIKVTPGGEPDTIQKAIEALPADSSVPARILLSAGTWCEKIELLRPNTIIEGAGADKTEIVWDDGAYAVLPDGSRRRTFRTATLRCAADHITLRRLTVTNSAAPREKVGQTIALYVNGDGFLAESCRFISNQDTVFLAPLPKAVIEPGGFTGPDENTPRRPQRHTFRKCTIEGDVDFIFGGAAAWFESCELISKDEREDKSKPYAGYVCAPSTPQNQTYGFVFKSCRFLNANCPQGSVYVGRPWRSDARITLLSCGLDDHIAEGWFDDWQKPESHERTRFCEYGCWGPGHLRRKVPYMQTLTPDEAAAITYDAFLAAPLDGIPT
ncbi:MAG: pectin methylesterase [Clostridia bacterium]|nr:pectin methylesterase [Clostridia bacterium]